MNITLQELIKTEGWQPPTPRAKQIMDDICDPTNWKLPTSSFESSDPQLLAEVAHALNFYLGGHEVTLLNADTNLQRLSSRGYYSYVGA